MGCNALCFGENSFLPAYVLVGFLHGLLFDLEDGGNKFFRNLGLTDCNSVHFGDSPMFRKNLLPPSSRSKSKLG
jgi:hypothetical protein